METERAYHGLAGMVDAPVLDAWDTGDVYVVWCAPERRWHRHSREDGHRVEHCYEGPYRCVGYVLRCVGPASPEILKDLKRDRRPRGPGG